MEDVEMASQPFLNAEQNTFQENALEIKLEAFVMRFVKEFEAKLNLYREILDGAIPKSGKYATTFAEIAGQSLGTLVGGAAGLAVGFPESGATAGKALGGALVKAIGDKVGRKHHQCKVTKLAEFIYYFENNKSEFRKMLVKVGLDIFQSFEMQFGRVSGDLGERGAMNHLAVDAVNRAIDYISRTLVELEADYQTLILKGVQLGQSKVEPVLNLPVPGRNSGFEIVYKDETREIKWKSASLYSKVGIVVINKHDNTYYKSKFDESQIFKYGFRRCFTCERSDELNGFYSEVRLSAKEVRLFEYSYFYNSDELNEKIGEICLKLESERDQTLGIDRINSLLKESKDEILEKLQWLKPVYNNSHIESLILSNIESCLRDLKFEENFSKFEVKLEEQLSEFESKLSTQFDDLRIQFEGIALTNATFQDSIWFDVRNDLINFTGRESILHEMEIELRTGPVVICGLGGIGKSELAVKYAHTRFDKSDNVVWVNAEKQESIADSIWRLAQAVNVNKMNNFGGEKPLQLIILEVYKILFKRKCLLIIDNARNYSEIESLLKWSPDIAQCQPKLIVTSRLKSDWKSARFSMQIIKLEVFEQSESIEFVRKALSLKDDSSTSDINKLIDVLGNFPLALQLAVTNVETTNLSYKKRNKQFTIKDFIEKFEKEPRKLLSGKLPFDMYHQQCSIFVIIVGFAYKDLEFKNELGEKAQLILRMASYLAPDNIREEFFQDEFDDEDELIEVMNLLENYSLVKIHDGKLVIHRLVQQAVRLNCEIDEEIVLRKNLKMLMEKLTGWDNITLCTPHIVSVWEYACNYEKLIQEFIVKSSNKFYIYTSFLQTLVSKNKFEIVAKIFEKIRKISDSKKLSGILRKSIDKKTFFLLQNSFNFEMKELLKANGFDMLDNLRNPTVTAMSQPCYVTNDCFSLEFGAQTLPTDLAKDNSSCTFL